MPLHTKTSANVTECPDCGSSKLTVDARGGETVCSECGSVIERHLIVQETQFEEAPSGSSQAVGQSVSHDPTAEGGASEFRKQTLRRNRDRIRDFGRTLHLPDYLSDSAFRLYKQLLTQKCSSGRPMDVTLAACVYIACRKQFGSVVMSDVADKCSVPVRDMDQAYRHISKALSIYVDTVDPEAYVEKYAFQLGIEDGQQLRELVTLAGKTARSMSDDGIDQGRRPGPVCGAALLAAADRLEIPLDLAQVAKVFFIF